MYVGELMPHRGEMVLIDDVIECGKDFICVKFKVSNDCAFLENGVFFTFNILEIMAQSLVVFRGMNDKSSCDRLGFLLGTRGFEILKPFVEVGKTIIIKTKISDDFEGIGVHESSAFVDNELIAKANITVFNPQQEQLENILKESEV